MCGKTKFCCLQIEIGVRIIGTICLITYVSVFIALVSGTHQVSEDERINIVIGFDSRLFSNENQTETINHPPVHHEYDSENLPVWVPIFYLFYSLIAAVSSALLIWASVTKERWLTIPWMVCSVANAGSQIASLTLLSFSHFTEKHKWITAATIIHSILILYFFAIVVAAQFFWKKEKKAMSKIYSQYETWENIFRSPPRFESPYKNKV